MTQQEIEELQSGMKNLEALLFTDNPKNAEQIKQTQDQVDKLQDSLNKLTLYLFKQRLKESIYKP